MKKKIGGKEIIKDEETNQKFEQNLKEEQDGNINNKIIFPEETMIGALSKYISTPNKNFQPMNANFGILPDLGERIKDKKLKYGKLADRAIEALNKKLV